jgi:hypothetical protein
VLFAGFLLFFGAPSVHAESIRIAPLQYQMELKKGEKKKGFVDVTNASGESVDLRFYVDGFKQVDTKGNLTFFDDEQVSKGLLLDYNAVTLDPHQTLRLFYVADGTKLPTGDVFGVIFAETKPTNQPGTSTSVRVGTLMMITNQTPGPRIAELTQVNVPFVQIGDSVSGQMTIKNPAPVGKATGFFPDIGVEVQPWGGQVESKGPLIFAGNERTADFSLPSNQFGFYRLKVYANNAEVYRIVFLITGWWRVIVPLAAVVLAGLYLLFKKHYLSKRILRKRQASK